MKIFNTVFEYTYYRITKAYLKWDGNEGYTAIWAISMVQALLICDFLIVILRIFYEWSGIMGYAKIGGIIGGGLVVVFGVLNLFKYKNKFNDYKIRWEKETIFQRRFRGILIIMFLIVPWVILFSLW
jgi:hypothetical protein